jgi:ribulose 1,5-bisphosphate synthetase/thiazole synthase
MSEYYKLERDIKIEDGYDLVVAGGGPAGCGAAIAAGRMGIRVMLIEAMGCLGGMSTSGLVAEFDPMANGERMLVGGIMREIVENMYDRGFLPDCSTPNRWRKDYHRYTPFQPEGLKLLLDDLVTNAGVEVRFFTKVIDADVNKDTGTLQGVVIQNVEGYRYIKAKTFVDGTGDAVLADLCDVLCRVAGKDTPTIMPPTLCALFAGINWEGKEFKYKECISVEEPEMIAKAIEEDTIFSQNDYHLCGMSKIDDTVGHLNGGHLYNMSSVHNETLTKAMFWGRKIVREYERFYKKYISGFENLQLVTTGSLLGVRESRRIVGEYEMNYKDFKIFRKFPDQIAVFGKAVDLHPHNSNKEEYLMHRERFDHKDVIPKGEYYGIPYGVLVPKGINNLWVAGRCVSTDIMVQAAIRVQPACVMEGQAAGAAAVQSINTGRSAKEINTAELVETLRKQGAYLPQEELSASLTLA